MTTLRQVTRLVRPLLERHPDLEQVGRWLFLKPVQHVARAVLVERISEAARFRVRWAVCHLCEPEPAFPLNWATMIRRDGLWEWDIPTIGEEFTAAVEDEALPAMRKIQTLDDFFAFASSPERFPLSRIDKHPLRKVGLDAARGEFADAREICRRMSTWSTANAIPGLLADYRRITQQLCAPLATDDRPAIAHALHEWEAETVANLKIGHIYEPTPFPFEVQTGGA